MFKSSTQDQPENNHKVILHLIYTLKRVLKCFKIEIKEKNINYVQINQEIKSKTIEKSEMDPNIFIKFLVIFKSQKLFFKLFKFAQTNRK